MSTSVAGVDDGERSEDEQRRGDGDANLHGGSRSRRRRTLPASLGHAR
jgi:hypothetical protein